MSNRFRLVFIFFLVLFSNFITTQTFAQTKNPQQAGQQMDNFSLSGITEKGKKNWDIAGKTADIGAEIIKLNDIVSNFYGKDENVLLTAQKGNFNRNQGNLLLEKDVVLLTSSGTRMTTDTLVWDRNAQQVSTNDPVNIAMQDVMITAHGAKGYPNLNTVDLEKNVEMRISSTDEQPGPNTVVINCSGPVQIDYQKNIAVFNNNVRVDSRDGVIESDMIEVYFLNKSRKVSGKVAQGSFLNTSRIDKIIARGNVKIIRQGNISYSEQAVYQASEKKIMLSGKPRLVISQQEDLNASVGN